MLRIFLGILFLSRPEATCPSASLLDNNYDQTEIDSSALFPQCASDLPLQLSPESLALSTAFESIKWDLRTLGTEACINYDYFKYQIPEYGSPNPIDSFYEDIEAIGGGSTHRLFKTTLKQHRATVENGTTIALRVKETSSDKKKRWFPRSLEAAMHLSQLRELGLTYYIPEVYSVYYTPYDPSLGFSGNPDQVLLVVEMEHLETDYEREFHYNNRKPISPRVAFEHVIGKWALDRISGCSIMDPDGDVLRHYMLKDDPDYLVCHIGERSYIFPPGLSPRQIDYDDFIYYSRPISQKEFETGVIYQNSRDYLLDKVESSSIRSFLEQVPEKGFLRSVYDNLDEFKVSPSNPLPSRGVRHLYISEDDLM